MEIDYAVVRHDHHPERWRWWCGVHEIVAGPDGALHWSENPVALVAHGEDSGPEALKADLGRILAAVAAAPVLSTSALMAAGGRVFDRYGGIGGPGRPGTPANDDEPPGVDAEGTAAE
jgi:hypothetical protein